MAWSELTEEDFAGDAEYWPRLWGWLEGGGRWHAVAYLEGADLSGFDPKAPPPRTDAWWRIVSVGCGEDESEIADVLDAMGRPVVFTIGQMVVAAGSELQTWLRDRKNSRSIPFRMAKAGYVPVRNPGPKDGLWIVGGRRVVVYGNISASVGDQIEAAKKL